MKPAKQLLERYLSHGVVELRCLDKHSELATKSAKGCVTWAGWYSEYCALKQAIIYADNQGWDVYQTINPVSFPAINGKLRPFQRTAKDADVSRINTIFFDFDPKREVGNAASLAQVMASEEQAMKVALFLDDHGWGAPTIGTSGNGTHLLYRTDMPVTKADYLKGLYAGLALRFDTEEIGFDVSVKNPGRIARALGTTNRKAGRRSEVKIFSNDMTPMELIIGMSEALTPPKPKMTWVRKETEERKGKFIKNWDVVGAFTGYGMYLEQVEPGKHWVVCPWEHEHTHTGSTDSVIWEGEWPTFHCSHSHCADRGIKDVIELMGGGYARVA